MFTGEVLAHPSVSASPSASRLDYDAWMVEPLNQVECATHGRGTQAFLCQHLIEESSLEFHRDDPTVENPYPDAWCRACEKVRRRAGGWDRLDPTRAPPIRLVCGHCYDNILLRHLSAPRTLFARLRSVFTSRTSWPLNDAITSPLFMPACSAALPDATEPPQQGGNAQCDQHL